MSNILHVEGLVAGYGTATVLHGLDFDVDSGDVVAILGRNGMGKTTFIHSIMGMVRARGGSIQFDGNDITTLPAHQISDLGMALVPQGRRVFAPLTVEENLKIAFRPQANGWALKDVYDMFPRLAERRQHKGDQLSGGEQQMVAIGRALLGNPRLLLLDEPSDGLAPAVVKDITRIVKGLSDNDQLSVVIVEQDLHSAFALADSVKVMERGRFVHASTTSEFRRNADVARKLLGVG